MTQIQRIVFTAPHAAALTTGSLDDTPLAAHEVVFRTLYSAISAATELAHYTGTSDLPRHISEDPYPWAPGYAAVGEVLDAGPESGVKRGDLILAHTSHQSVSRFDTRQRICAVLPEGISLPHATLGRIGQVGAVALRTSSAHAGEWAAVVGLGIIGACAAQLLRAAGLRVLGVEPTAGRRERAEAYGLAGTLDPTADGAIADAVQRTGGCAFILECSGQPRGLQAALALAAPHGEIAMVGAAWRRETDVLATDIMRPVFDRFLTLRSGWEWQLPLYGSLPTGSIAACTDWVLACIRDGSLNAGALITDTITPAEAQTAYRWLLDEPQSHLGVIIDWTKSA